MPLHSEDHSSDQALWLARVFKLLLIAMKKLEKAGHEPCYEQICYAAGYLFPQYYLPNDVLKPALQHLCHTGLVVPVEPNRPTTGFRLTQAGRDFDLKQTWRLLFSDAAAKSGAPDPEWLPRSSPAGRCHMLAS